MILHVAFQVTVKPELSTTVITSEPVELVFKQFVKYTFGFIDFLSLSCNSSIEQWLEEIFDQNIESFNYAQESISLD